MAVKVFQKMKLLIINSDALFEDKGRYFIHQSTGSFLQELIHADLEISLFHFKEKLSWKTISDYELSEKDIKLHCVTRKKTKLISHLVAFIDLMKIMRNIDFLYVFYPNAFFYSIFIAVLFQKPFGIYLRGEKGLNSIMSKFIFRKARFVVTISPQFTDFVQRQKGIGYTVKPMININFKKPFLRNFKDEYAKFNLLYVGRIEREKGIFELIESIEILKKTFTNFSLNLVGNGKDLLDIKQIIKSHNLENWVCINGKITKKQVLENLYKQADIFVFPSHHEGFPRVLYEAMIFKLPILTTFVGSVPYLMKDSINCYEIKAKNPASIVEKLIFLICNPSVRRKISENGFREIQDYYKKNNLPHSEILKSQLLIDKP